MTNTKLLLKLIDHEITPGQGSVIGESSYEIHNAKDFVFQYDAWTNNMTLDAKLRIQASLNGTSYRDIHEIILNGGAADSGMVRLNVEGYLFLRVYFQDITSDEPFIDITCTATFPN